jgi:NAD(P)H-hydrate epimerase
MEAWLRPLFDAPGMRAADEWAIAEQGVPSLRLMETAGRALAERTRELAGPGSIRVVCGKGNNGGDGLVAARLLCELGFEVETLLLWPADQLSPDAAENLRRLPGAAMEVGPERIADALAGSGAIVDAIFGTGFAGEPRTPASEAIEAMNAAGAPIVAADIASGVDASTGEIAGVAARATATVTFHAAKVGHRIAPGKAHTGALHVAPIGIPPGAPAAAPAGEITDAVLADLPRRGPASTKFTSGQVLVLGGSRGLTGAVCLVASAAIRAGAGYATALVPASLEQIFEVKLTEVMTRALPDSDGALNEGAAADALAAAERADALVVGPGLGRSDGAFAVARAVAQGAAVPLVLDADGLNAHAQRLDALAGREAPTVLTPHAGELGRLLGIESRAVGERRLECARRAAAAARAIVVLKGDDTLIVDGREDPDTVAVSALPSPALATAGTGDTLAGTIGALIARGVEPLRAACAAVHANARAGRIAAERVGSAESVIATDVVAALPEALAEP